MSYWKNFPNKETSLSDENLSRAEQYQEATATTDGDYKLNITGATELEINDVVKVYFPSATDSNKQARLSIDDGATYYDVNDRLASGIEERTAELQFDGTDWVVVGGEAQFIWENDVLTNVDNKELKVNLEQVKGYKPGDVLKFNPVLLNGFITSVATMLRLAIPLPYTTEGVSGATVKSFNVEGRGNKGYWNSVAGYIQYVGSANYTFSFHMSENHLTLNMLKSTAFTNVDNNTQASAFGEVEIEFY